MTTQLEGLASGDADFSADRRYRYRLDRTWADGRHVLWVMLNPSTADEDTPDATLRRCLRFSRDWGFGRLSVVNLYALVSTDPAGLWRADDPIGPENDAAIALAAQQTHAIVVAWGADAPHPARAKAVTDILRVNALGDARRIQCLGRTKLGHPRHPVRLAASTLREVFYG